MKLQCLIKSRYPGAYNKTLDFGELGAVQVIDGIADVEPELAAHMVEGGYFVRLNEFQESIEEDEPQPVPVAAKVARKARVATVVESVE